MSKKIFFLDWDGCMAKTLHVWMNTYMALYKEAGILASESDIIEKSWGNLEQGPRNFGISDAETFWQKIVANVRVGVSTVTLYDGVKETLKQLQEKGVLMAIVTSSERSLVLPPIKYNGLEEYFGAIVTPDDIINPKPHREIIDKAVNLLGGDLQSDDCYIIGDTGSDIKTGKAAGIKSVFINHVENAGFTPAEKVRSLEPTYEVTSFDALCELTNY